MRVVKSKGRPPLPDVWSPFAAGMAKGDRVVVKGAEESRALRAALAGLKVRYGRKLLLPPVMQRKRGEAVKLADGQYVVTQIGPVPLLAICGACAGASCAACTRGRVVGKRGPEQCECRHDRHIPLVGPGRSGYLDTGGMVVTEADVYAGTAGPCSGAYLEPPPVVPEIPAIPDRVPPMTATEMELRAEVERRRAWVRRQMQMEEERIGGRS